MIDGVGKDAPIITNVNGGKQSFTPYAFHLIDPYAMFELARITHEGAIKYAPGNWLKISTAEHLNHALQHIYAYLAGDTQDDHLAHAFTRMMFAVRTDKDENLTQNYDKQMKGA